MQIVVKAINDTARLNSLILTLLVFKAYLRLTKLDPSHFFIKQQAATIKKAIKEVQKLHAIKKVNNALSTRNSFSTTYIHNLRLKNKVLVH